MTRPPIEDLDRLHGEATAERRRIIETCESDESVLRELRVVNASVGRDHLLKWPQVSEYIRELESEIKQAQRRMHEAGHKSAAAMLNDVRRMMGDAVK